MDRCSWNWKLTLFLWKKGWLQELVQRNTAPLKILDHCKWPPETMTAPLKCAAASALLKCKMPSIGIPVKYIVYTHFLVASALLKKYCIHWGMDGRNYFCEIWKLSTLIKTVPYDQTQKLTRRKCFFRNNYFWSQPFLMSCYFTRIFVHLSVIAAVCYFSVSKLIRCTLETFTCSKSAAGTLEKGVKYVQS